MNRDYKQYQLDVTDDIQACLESLECQPILFIGSGLTRRYANGPDWESLLKNLMEQCPEIKRPFAYYTQKNESLIDIGTILSDAYRDWAWAEGKSNFPEELFSERYDGDIYLKYKIADFFNHLEIIDGNEFADEIKSLKSIHPHSIVTTNYDNIVDRIFPDHEIIVGQKIIRLVNSSTGEIFKIHGSCNEPASIVINRNDYDDFLSKKKYLSAKLLTFFAEHPLIFIGYSIEDENIKGILSDIDEILSEEGELIPNIYILNRDKEIDENSYPAREAMINIDNNKHVRIKRIVSNNFKWVFEAFAAHPAMDNVNPKVLRALLARNYKLINSDIPMNTVSIDYTRLTELALDDGKLERVYGITDGDALDLFNANYCFTMTSLAESLGYRNWNYVNQLIQKIKEATGKDIKETDNIYHQKVRTGRASFTRKYSREALRLLELARDNKPFDVHFD
ncbi:SIR2 family protein [Xenorhabdus budapestensis]|uniref:SIR2 family protein n=1 Tax=Xenorhabdus budapestensis TaxID=290110 RepID=A0ABX7VMZ0_XENBU|nr:SIR2 family protein [Xenorhabdus budapestensis]QTL41002.1 SIR2 family protein [Xenorhabdus budapestensis]